MEGGWPSFACFNLEPDCTVYVWQLMHLFAFSCLQNYYDNRYWTMWKLPMFGCQDPSQVLAEINKCARAFPNSYQRLVSAISDCCMHSLGTYSCSDSAV